MKEGLIIYFVEEPILLHSAGGSRRFFFNLEEGLIIYFVEEPILLNSAGGSREFFSSGRRTFIAFVEEPTLLHSAGGSRVFFFNWKKDLFFTLCRSQFYLTAPEALAKFFQVE